MTEQQLPEQSDCLTGAELRAVLRAIEMCSDALTQGMKIDPTEDRVTLSILLQRARVKLLDRYS
jgi:hypothetical protein